MNLVVAWLKLLVKFIVDYNINIFIREINANHSLLDRAIRNSHEIEISRNAAVTLGWHLTVFNKSSETDYLF